MFVTNSFKKRFAAIVIILTLAAIFISATACDNAGFNQQVVDTNYRFDYAILFRADGEQRIPIKSWLDWEDSDMIQFTATDGTVYYTHSSNVILVCGE